MKLVRGAAVLAGLIDFVFALLFIINPEALDDPEAVYPRWLGVCLLASAVMLFMIVSDPERYLPLLYVNIGARAVAALIGLLHVRPFVIIITTAVSNGAPAVILIAALVYAARQARSASVSSGTQSEPKEKTKPSGGGKKGEGKKT
jgi:hypothetical protein